MPQFLSYMYRLTIETSYSSVFTMLAVYNVSTSEVNRAVPKMSFISTAPKSSKVDGA